MKNLIFSFAVLLLSACANGGVLLNETTASLPPPKLTRTDFMTNLHNPWDLAFASDGSLYFTEKCRGLSVRKTDGTIIRLFGTSGSNLIATDLFCEGQSGMLGVALDPQFATNRYIYVYMSSRLDPKLKTNRVIRLKVQANSAGVSERNDIVSDISYKNVGNTWGGAGSHSGGRLRFGLDGYLYITTGDNHNGSLPQDLKKLGGKVLRVDRNGTAAPNNNLPAGADPRIFTFGHRNVQGLSFHPQSRQAYIAEHGPGHSDEVTPLVAGGNGGWDPKPDPGVTCADNYCGYTSNNTRGTPTSMTDFLKFPNAMKPLVVYGDSMGMGPCLFLLGTQWKSWEDSFLVSLMAGQRLDILRLTNTGTVADTSRAPLPSARMRSLAQGNDGALYIAIDEGKIWKVVPQ